MFILFALIACNKRDGNILSKNTCHNTGNKVETVNQKMYNISAEQVKSSIESFTSVDNLSNSKNFTPESNLLPDSSVLILEAALNYHFDNTPDDHDIYLDSC